MGILYVAVVAAKLHVAILMFPKPLVSATLALAKPFYVAVVAARLHVAILMFPKPLVSATLALAKPLKPLVPATDVPKTTSAGHFGSGKTFKTTSASDIAFRKTFDGENVKKTLIL